MHWDDVDQPLVEFTASVSRLRRDHPTFRRKRFFTGTTVRTGSGDGERLNDIVWLHPEGHPIEDGDWTAPGAQSIGMYLNGARHPGRRRPRWPDRRRPLPALLQRLGGRRTADPAAGGVRRGLGRRDRHRRHASATTQPLAAGSTSVLGGRSVLVLREHTVVPATPDSSVAASVAASQASRADKAG